MNSRSAWVVAHWTIFLLAAVVVWCMTALALTAGIPESTLNRVVVCALLVVSVTIYFVLYVKVSKSHKPKIAVVSLLAVAAFVVQCVPYPNVGLPFGYWAYPNRAITAFLNCPNVQSAMLTGWNKDTSLEEFLISVTFTDKRGGTINQGIPFAQYPSREYIGARVATVGCRP